MTQIAFIRFNSEIVLETIGKVIAIVVIESDFADNSRYSIGGHILEPKV